MSFTIIDRRKNPNAKSLPNRQKFTERAQKAIRESAKKALGTRSINDQSDININIPLDGLDEPRFRYGQYGEYDYVLPGNTEHIVGDKIKKKKSEGGGQGGGAGQGEGGEDEFNFVLSYDEYLDIIFDDLELPDLIKKTEKNTLAFTNKRAGYSHSGNPSNINVVKTLTAGLMRRTALKTPKFKKIHELEEELENLPVTKENEEYRLQIEDEITSLRARAMAVTFLDDIDLRYNNFIKQPKPTTQAVMFALMDVSFSMGQREKIIAKKFFILLHLFLKRRYKNIDVVFVRHHDTATECDEETFFTLREGGGTVVSSGYEKIKEIIASRYNADDWNIYISQVSDGDNYGSDNDKVRAILATDLLPVVQHFIYIEIDDESAPSTIFDFAALTSNLWLTIFPLVNIFENISCAQITDERQVVNVFRKLFKKEQA